MATVLAIEITPSTPTQWSAHYYPTVETPAGRRVEITTPLHRQSLPTAQCLEGPTRWLEVTTDDPGADCYTGYPVWGPHLAAGYAAALTVLAAEAIACPPVIEDTEAMHEATVLVTPGQLSEWLLTDLNAPHA